MDDEKPCDRILPQYRKRLTAGVFLLCPPFPPYEQDRSQEQQARRDEGRSTPAQRERPSSLSPSLSPATPKHAPMIQILSAQSHVDPRAFFSLQCQVIF